MIRGTLLLVAPTEVFSLFAAFEGLHDYIIFFYNACNRSIFR